MKLKTFLSTTSLLFFLSAHSASNEISSSLLWGNAKLTSDATSSEITTSTDDNYFFSTNVKVLDLDLDEDNFYFHFKIQNLENFHGLEIRFSNKKSSQSYFSYTLPYFTDRDFNPFKPNEWLKYGVSMANLKPHNKPSSEIKYISFFLFTKKKPMTFSVKDFSKKKKPLEGIASITFDDGYKSQILAAQITKKLGLTATAYIMPRNIENPTLIDIKEAHQIKDMGWDIQSHHATPLTLMGKNKTKKELLFGVNFLKKNKLNSKSHHFAYPLGKHNQLIVDEVQSVFKTARLAGAGIETIPPADNFRIRTFNVLNTTTLTELKEHIDKAKKNKQWLILMFHYLKKLPKGELEYSIENFELFCKYLKSSGLKTLTIDEVYRNYLK